MADAGKILIMPKGYYDPNVSYEILDLVSHNDITWLAKKDVIGIEPNENNSEYWFKMTSSSIGTIDRILDGTTPVGDSNKLGGKSASEYALDADLANYLPKTGGTLTDVLRFRKVNNGEAYLQKNHSADGDLGFYLADTSGDGNLARLELSAKEQKVKFTGTDRVAKEILHTGNVGTYALPLTGSDASTIKRANAIPISIENTQTNSTASYMGFKSNNVMCGRIGFSGVDKPMYVPANGQSIHELLHTGNVGSYALPIINPTAKSVATSNNAMTVQGMQSAEVVWINYLGSANAVLGRLGFSAKDTPAFLPTSGGSKALHHDGNSARVVVSQTPLTSEGSIRVW